MRINEYQKFLVNLFSTDKFVPILSVGQMGVGKTWSVEEAAMSVDGFGFVDLRLATQEPGDITGLPYTYEDSEGGKVHGWTRPSWFPTKGRGVIHLDEINRAPKDVQQAIFQLVGERRLHTHKLPEGWHIVASINPDNGEYQVDRLGIAMKRRFAQLAIEPNALDWVSWGKEYGINKNLLLMVEENNDTLFRSEEIKLEVIRTPEGWRMVDLLDDSKVDLFPSANARLEVISGIVGEEAALLYEEYRSKNISKFLKFEDVINEKHTVEGFDNDQLSKTLESIAHTVVEEKHKALEGNELENFIHFAMSMDDEWFTSLIVAITDNKEFNTVFYGTKFFERVDTL